MRLAGVLIDIILRLEAALLCVKVTDGRRLAINKTLRTAEKFCLKFNLENYFPYQQALLTQNIDIFILRIKF